MTRAADPIERRLVQAREKMVREHIEARGVTDARLLQALRDIPRHLFVREQYQAAAYGDRALPIEGGQTISQPYVVARMTEILAVEAGHKVLEIGTGTGYQTAILARLARWVYSLERVPELATLAIARLKELGLKNVKIEAFDGTLGWLQAAPFDRILVTAGAPRVPEPLLEQLAEKGRLLIPEGDRESQRLVLYRKTPRGVRREVGEPVAFVPLVGKHGWERPG